MKQEVIFSFDTSIGSDQVQIELCNETMILARTTIHFTSTDTQSLLKESMQLLQSHSCTPQNLVGVAVIFGTSRFTVARLCAVIANALSWSLHVPALSYVTPPAISTLWDNMHQQAKEHAQSSNPYPLIDPHYTKEPNITL
ncbi:MAG TPA: hypothetical protein VJB65_00005 [Patescibacteria group bacterium]|nr:hypothetical protein [Patescibacteria group bacterium]